MRDLFELPKDLPVPQDDGSCRHLEGRSVPEVSLPSTFGHAVNLKAQSQRPTVVFFYPRTGEPHLPAPPDWDLIPGARGCTPQSCAFRDLHEEFRRRGHEVFGCSSQGTAYQQEFAERNHIPFPILSDERFLLTDALKLPTFTYNSMRLVKRLALVLDEGVIRKVFYPVFPPDKNAETVLRWLQRGENA